MSKMVERVANAIWDADDQEARGLTDCPRYAAMARAAIEAMSDPTDEMLKAAGVELRQWDRRFDTAEVTAHNAYVEMIDVALTTTEAVVRQNEHRHPQSPSNDDAIRE